MERRVAVEWLVLLFRILEVPGSNLDWYIGYPDWAYVILFIVYLATLSVARFASNERWYVNDELERMWKKSVVA
jgi:hypothetical protein